MPLFVARQPALPQQNQARMNPSFGQIKEVGHVRGDDGHLVPHRERPHSLVRFPGKPNVRDCLRKDSGFRQWMGQE